MLGWSSAEAVGQPAFDLLGCTFDDAGHEQMRSWTACKFRSRKRHKDGRAVPVHVHFEPMHDGEGGHHGLVLLDGDAAANRELEAHYRSVVESMQEGVVVQAEDGTILSCNLAAERILGLSAAQMCGRSSLDPRWRGVREDGSPYPGDSLPSMVTARTGRPLSHEVMGVHKPDGTLTWISINTAVVEPVGSAGMRTIVVTFADITAQKRQEAQLRAQKEQLQFVLDGNNDGFWDWHVPSGRVEFSERWAAMLGYSRADLAPHVGTWEQLVHPADRADVERLLQAHLRGDTPFYETEHRVRCKDGRWLWVLDRGKVVERDEDGKPVRVAGTHTDTTARHAAEAKLREALQQNEQLVRELREALDKVKVLSGLLPVCAWCKSVRNDAGYWQRIEDYLSERTDTRFTHGLCPTCNERLSLE
jgi:PAS domain S-box-containing protein